MLACRLRRGNPRRYGIRSTRPLGVEGSAGRLDNRFMSSRPLVVHVVGARPNYMKVAPLYAALERRGRVSQRLVHTGQHYDANVNDVFFAELPLPAPHVQLAVGSGSHAEQTARALTGLEAAFLDLEPDLVVVPGDVNSTLAGAIAAVKLGLPVCHLEAGLR